MRTINLSDEDYKRVQEVLQKAKEVKEKKKTIIYKTDGSILYKSDKETVKEAVVEAVNGETDLRGADLREADLGGVNLRGADLWGANLREADLREADLRGADLWGANLRGADLLEADLREAEMENAKFYGKGGIKPLKKEQVKDFLAALGFVIEE